MAARKSLAAALFAGDIETSPVLSSSPLRRKSCIAQRVCSTPLDENDDEAELSARRRDREQIERSVTSTPANSTDRRRSLGLINQMSGPQITEQYNQCIKLCAENKINVKNAFSLQMIDFMTYMMRKRDDQMNNLQVASTTLDVSTKIYGYRVDSVHTDMLKIAGGLGRESKEGDADEAAAPEVNESMREENQVKKKKKKKMRIMSTVEALRGPIEVANPSSAPMREADSSERTDMLFQAILPKHADSEWYLQPHVDVRLDSGDGNKGRSQEMVQVPRPCIGDLTGLDVCEPFANFQFQNWSAEDEEVTEDAPDPPDNILQFDLEASLLDNDDHRNSGANFFDVEDAAETVERCNAPGRVENIVDFRQAVQQPDRQNMNLEYSYMLKSVAFHWAGPMHWKVRNFPNKSLSHSAVIGTCRQEQVKKKKDVELSYNDEKEESYRQKFIPGQAVKLQAKTAKVGWQEERLTLPQDVHYDIEQASKYYNNRAMMKILTARRDANATLLADDVADYDYNNENDMTNFCPNVVSEELPAGDDVGSQDGGHFEDDDDRRCSQGFTGDNLVAMPQLTNKIFIPYSMRAKKVDMRQLKGAIWKLLTQKSNEKENMDICEAVAKEAEKTNVSSEKNFSEVYKILPETLSKANAEALSFPIAFVSLLHLANEKTLFIQSTPDLLDLNVTQG